MTLQRRQRWTLIGLCLIAAFAASSAQAQAGAPRWYGKETGVWVPYSGNAGLVEPLSPEPLESMGLLSVSGSKSKNPSNCLVKDRELIEDPTNVLSAGTGAMEEFEVICENGTGPLNAAAPFPCVLVGEPFELIGVKYNWPSTLEVGASRRSVTARARRTRRTRRTRRAKRAVNIGNLPRYYDHFTGVDIEIYCLVSKEHAEYSGSLKPEVNVGRLVFNGPESGELEEASSGERLYFKGSDLISSKKYKDIRVNSEYHEQPTITSLSPTKGPVSGGTSVTVSGRNFALGTSATIFKFGTKNVGSRNCESTTTCILVSPAHEVGTVDVRATVNKLSSAKVPEDHFTYE